ncbi:quinone-dependent dihydroorotate dehydrogenase [Staphylococcus aureus]|uniref:quinone-dependent dihydroorotate dehydrogenase n=1 Tax=Staphylococcus aureus TaxID=1280 RepID=UPI0016540A76|nr:quinone-dependent dihydroorotate dehydrogenase [Staphylococcus aureus]HDK4771683.1 quinone-dependent dihydroorotate dehydrogenase [Staphylococcus aureus]HDK4782619.1 quinone-dependent dihydroorotate dehydrogenase [Staphylococcus aureus]
MYKLLSKILFRFDPEKTHNAVIKILKIIQKSNRMSKLLEGFYDYNTVKLSQTINGISFPNPIGLAAGFDKYAELPQILEKLGFGYIEVGGITPLPQKGNAKPRLFRLVKDKALINRMGFNNDGSIKCYKNLHNKNFKKPIGVNIGVNKDSKDWINDYIKVIDQLVETVDYFTINISSPNTKGLQTLHNPREFKELSEAIKNHLNYFNYNIPIYLKVTSDITFNDLDYILETAPKYFNGIVLANTSQKRKGLLDQHKYEKGGLSGRPLFNYNLQLIKYSRSKVPKDFTIIGTGGIFTTDDAISMLKAGANILQIYTSFVYEGPKITKSINKELELYMKRNNIKHISEI